MRRYLNVREFLASSLASVLHLGARSLAVLSVFGMLLAVPALFLPGKKAPFSQHCLGNLRQLSTAIRMYVEDYDETYPYSDSTSRTWDLGPSENVSPIPVPAGFHSSSRWVLQLFPYVKNAEIFACRGDADRQRNMKHLLVAGSATPFPVSYGPNRYFVDPSAYGWKTRAVSLAAVAQPEQKYVLADCATAYGFDLDTVAYIRYPNYNSGRQQHGWSPGRFRAAGQVAWPAWVAMPMTRHDPQSQILFADGHVGWARHDDIPGNDGPGGVGYRALTKALVPWHTVHGKGSDSR